MKKKRVAAIWRHDFQVAGSDDSEVNGGFIVAREEEEGDEDLDHHRSYPLVQGSSATPICCGSDALLRSGADLRPTGNFTRQATIGSVKIVNAPGSDADVFPPERITDLRLEFAYETMEMNVSFTSPGDDFYEGRGE